MNIKLGKQDSEKVINYTFEIHNLGKALKQSLQHIESETTYGGENVYLAEQIEKKALSILDII